MMLQALYELALRESLLDDPDFEKRAVSFLVRVDADGGFRGLQATWDDRGKGIPRSVPRAPLRTVAVASGFLVDNAQYVFGMMKKADREKLKDAKEIKKKSDRNAECATAFRGLVAEAASRTGDEGLIGVQRFLGRWEEQRQRVLDAAPPAPAKKGQQPKAYEWTGDEVIAFGLDSDDESLVHDREAVRAWWRGARRGTPSADQPVERIRCLVTGEMGAPEANHPPIKRVPAGQTSGTKMVSFNAAAFVSQGCGTNEGHNAPVTARGADGYARALNWLLEEHGGRRFRQGIALREDAAVVYWTREANSLADLVGRLDSTMTDDARAMVESPWKGLEPEATDATKFYVLTLGGNAARVMIRDWFESTAGSVKQNLRRYFDDLRIDGQDDRPLPLRPLLRALMVHPEAKDKQELPPDLAARLLRSALLGLPFPRQLLARAQRRIRAAGGFTLTTLCALIKATLNRFRSTHNLPEVSVSLDEGCTQVSYLLGRLFAVLEKLQTDAIGATTTIRDRYFTAAASTPAVVFPRLLSLSVHHVAKLQKDGGTRLERIKAGIIDQLPARAMPSTLALEDQGLFSIGYYHQRQALYRKGSGGAGSPQDAPIGATDSAETAT